MKDVNITSNLINKKRKVSPAGLIAISFLGLIVVGAILLSLNISSKNGASVGVVRAFFTATSAVCVTGLGFADTFTTFTLFGQIIILLLIQCGGLGFMSLATLLFIFAGKRITLKERLILQEAYSQDDLTGLLKLTKNIIYATLIVEGVGAVLLAFTMVPQFGIANGLYLSVFHSISAFCNAGFDIFGTNESLVGFATSPFVLIVVSSLIILGGLGFVAIFDLLKAKFKVSRLKLHTKIVLFMTLFLIAIGTIVVALLEWNNPSTLQNLSFFDKIINSYFQSVTTRTAGFASLNQSDLTPLTRFSSMVLMFIGASPAGTGGGIKTTTFMLFLLVFAAGAKGEDEVVVFGKSLKIKPIMRAVSIIIMAIVTIVTLSVSVYLIENNVGNLVSLEECFFESISAFSTVGLSMGITSTLSSASLLLICCVMFIGRLGALFLGLMFFKKNSHIKRPEDKIILG